MGVVSAEPIPVPADLVLRAMRRLYGSGDDANAIARELLALMPTSEPSDKQVSVSLPQDAHMAEAARDRLRKLHDSGWESAAVECRACDRAATIPIEGGGRAILAGALLDWYFTSESGWLCPDHAPSSRSAS